MSILSKRRLAPSMRKILILLLALFIPVTLLSVFFLMHSLSESEHTARLQLQDRVESTLQQLDDELSSTNLYLLDILVNNPDVRTAASQTDTITVNNALRGLQTTLASQREYLIKKYNYLYYNPNRNLSAWVLDDTTSYMDNTHMKTRLLSEIQEGTLSANSQVWNCLLLNGTAYLIQAYQNENGYMLCWIPARTAFSFLSDTAINGLYSLVDASGAPLMNMDDLKDCGVVFDKDGNPTSQQDYTCTLYDIGRADFQLLLVTQPLIDYNSLHTFIVFILAVLFLLACFCLYTFYYFSHYIAHPFEEFRKHIASYAEHFQSEKRRGFAELNQAVSAFDSLTRQLEDLKIDIYEERIALAKTELEYFQLQIKPHFFTNCFGIIFNMAQNEEFETIQQFCVSLSTYVRYLFKDGFSMVPLETELHLTREYLQIQNTRYHTQLFLSEAITDNLLHTPLPPLLVLTFVENSVKHTANRRDLGIVIRVQYTEEKEDRFLYLEIMDNGPGFSPSILQKLNQLTVPGATHTGEDTDTHIGIRNISKRLSLLYGSRYTLRFSNLPAETGHSGARVEVRIPVQSATPDRNMTVASL